MEAIKIYLDNVFASFPLTEKVLTLKREMLAGMEEKYNALKSEGKSEHEAIGSVISNFGNIDEIAAELEIEQSKYEPIEGIVLSEDEARSYLEQTKKSGVWIGIGQWLIEAGIAAMLLFRERAWVAESGELFTAMGFFAMLLMIAAAVPIFIVNGMRMNRFEPYQSNRIRLDAITRAELERMHTKFMPGFVARISLGIAAMLLSVGAMVMLGQTAGFDYMTMIPPLLFVIGFAVFLIITAGVMKSAYDILLGKGDFVNKANYSKTEKLIGSIASVYWPLIVAAFLLWGFLGNSWRICWVIWPVAGVLFGGIAGGISTWYAEKNR